MLTTFGLQGDLKKNYQFRVIFMSKDFLNYLATQSRQQLTTDERAVVDDGHKAAVAVSHTWQEVTRIHHINAV